MSEGGRLQTMTEFTQDPAGNGTAVSTGLDEVDVLVGIPSFNNERTIGHVVRAVVAGLAKYFPARAVLVNSDGGSTDRTRGSSSGPRSRSRLRPRRRTGPRRVHKHRHAVPRHPRKGERLPDDLRDRRRARGEGLLRPRQRPAEHHAGVDRAPPRARPDDGYEFVAPLLHAAPVRRDDHEHDRLPADPGPLRQADPPADRRRLRLLGTARPRSSRRGVWESAVARFGIDICMTTTALADGRICQSFLGAKIHDPKDPGSDLAP